MLPYRPPATRKTSSPRLDARQNGRLRQQNAHVGQHPSMHSFRPFQTNFSSTFCEVRYSEADVSSMNSFSREVFTFSPFNYAMVIG
ncbi:hypothetical protein VTL71DRAFT_8799, partial [Oculimacula yallundae]